MASYRFVANDILEDLKQKHDDFEISLIQVVYWIQIVANRLRYKRIEENRTGKYLSTYADVEIKFDNNFNPARKYIDLPAKVYDFPEEQAISYITYCFESEDCCDGPQFSLVNFMPTTPERSMRLYFNEYEKPTSKNPYFYRVGERLYFLGIECVNVECVEVGLFSSLDPGVICDLDQEISISDEQIVLLKYEVMNIGRFAMQIPKERINDGADSTTQQLFQTGTGLPAVPQPQQSESQ